VTSSCPTGGGETTYRFPLDRPDPIRVETWDTHHRRRAVIAWADLGRTRMGGSSRVSALRVRATERLNATPEGGAMTVDAA
jgi:hypothetical protein